MFRALYTAAGGMDTQQMISTTWPTTSPTPARPDSAGGECGLPALVSEHDHARLGRHTADHQRRGLQVGLGTKPGASEVLQLQGDFRDGNPFDLAIQGQDFSGHHARRNCYTRAGTFIWTREIL
jgi:flagellar basal-body rod protein FlgG